MLKVGRQNRTTNTGIDVYNSQAPPKSGLKTAVGSKSTYSFDNLQCSKRHFIFMHNELLLCFTDHFPHGLYLVLNLMMYMKVFYKQKIVMQILAITKIMMSK